MHSFQHIISPLAWGNVILKSHIYSSSALPHYLQGPETYPSDALMTFLSSLAQNGAALIPLDECTGYPEIRFQGGGMPDAAHMPMFDMQDPSVQNKLSELADEIHFHSSKLLLKTELVYPEGYSLNGGTVMDFLKGTTYETMPLSEEVMSQMIDNFVAKIQLYHGLGYDGISIRTDKAVGWVPNERQDEYGGNVQNRTRLLRRCLSAVKQVLGKEFLIEAVMAGELPFGYGGDFDAAVDSDGKKILEITPQYSYSLEDTIEFLLAFDGIIDIVQLRERDAFLAQPTTYNFTGVHQTADYARKIRTAGFHGLLALNGGFQDPSVVENYLRSGDCDLICMGRAFFADFDYFKKIREKRAADIVPCIMCNRCHGTISAPWISFCSVNPQLGLQHKISRLVTAPERRKHVAVIGGGPAGMRAAITAAERGHQVTLFEKESALGGQLSHADVFRFKRPLLKFKQWLIHRLEELDVEVYRSTVPNPERLRTEGYDCVISAVGSRHIVPKICAEMPEHPMTCWDVIGHEKKLGHRILLLGGSHTGVETAMYLADAGHEVIILSRQKQLAKDAPPLHNITMDHAGQDQEGHIRTFASWERYPNLSWVTGVRYERVTDHTVTYTEKNGAVHTLEADGVVISGGVVSRTSEAMAYANCAEEFYCVGDCNGMRNLQQCTRDAYAKASHI